MFPRVLTLDISGGGRRCRSIPTVRADSRRDRRRRTAQKSGFVADSLPRIASNLIVDQTANNPAAFAANRSTCGSGGFVCGDPGDADPVTGSLFIPNITPDFGLSAPFNLMFTFFGQFFDHGLDLVTKGGGTVLIPLQPDDPLFVRRGSQTNFMAMTRGTNQPGPDGILGTADDVQEQHEHHDAVGRPEPDLHVAPVAPGVPAPVRAQRAGRPVQTGKVLDGGFCAPRPTGIAGDDICNIANWAEVKAQASDDARHPARRHRRVRRAAAPDRSVRPLQARPERASRRSCCGNGGCSRAIRRPTAGSASTIPANALHTGHAFLNDIAHNAVPGPA